MGECSLLLRKAFEEGRLLEPEKGTQIAVGTVIADRPPPHRSVRDELRHTAPPSGQTIAKIPLPVVIAVPLQLMLGPALSPEHR